jgi:hypothetical protein
MLLYAECHTYLNTLHLTPKDRPLLVNLLQQVMSPGAITITIQSVHLSLAFKRSIQHSRDFNLPKSAAFLSILPRYHHRNDFHQIRHLQIKPWII